MTKTNPAPETPPAPETEADPFEHLVPGRIVHYYPTAYLERASCAGPWPAMVTKVGPLPGVVTLNVNLPMPTPIGEDPVQRIADVSYAAEPTPGCWSWIFPGQAGRYKPDRTA